MNELTLSNPTDLKVTGPKLGDAFNKMAGPAAPLVENLMYGWCDNHVEDYNGGCWENVEAPNGAIYRRLMDPDATFKVDNPAAYWEGEMSANAMGMTATLFGLNHALWRVYKTNEALAKKLETAYYKLRDFALDGPDAGDIYAATN